MEMESCELALWKGLELLLFWQAPLGRPSSLERVGTVPFLASTSRKAFELAGNSPCPQVAASEMTNFCWGRSLTSKSSMAITDTRCSRRLSSYARVFARSGGTAQMDTSQKVNATTNGDGDTTTTQKVAWSQCTA